MLSNLLNQNGGSKTDTIVKLILVFFVSLLSFSVGTFVGKQFSDSQHRLAALEKDYEKESHEDRSVASVPHEGLEVEPTEILSQEDVAKLAEEFVQESPHGAHAVKRDVAAADPKDHSEVLKTATPEEELKPTIKETATTHKPEATAHAEATTHAAEVSAHKLDTPAHKTEKTTPSVEASHKAEKSLPQEAANKIAEDRAALEPVKKQESAKKIALPKVTSTDVRGKYTIQISSHSNEPDAKSQTQDLISKGYAAFYVPAQIDGKMWYRVSVGNYVTSDAAKEYLVKIKSNVMFKDAIVRKVTQ